jgi:hypothetical protein
VGSGTVRSEVFPASEILRCAINKYVTVTLREVVDLAAARAPPNRSRRSASWQRPFHAECNHNPAQIFIEMIASPLPLRPGHSPKASCPRLGSSFGIGRQEGWYEREVFLSKVDPRFARPRVVQLLLGHTKRESTVRYLGIEVDNAPRIAEQIEL